VTQRTAVERTFRLRAFSSAFTDTFVAGTTRDRAVHLERENV
jgi:hypothetical protein